MKVAQSFTPDLSCQMPLSLYVHSLSAGLDSPAENDDKLDLNEYLIRRPESAFYASVRGNNLFDQGIFDGDLLLVDRQLKPQHGHLVVVSMAGELSCRLFDLKANSVRGFIEDEQPVALDQEADLRIEGVVMHSVRHHGRYL